MHHIVGFQFVFRELHVRGTYDPFWLHPSEALC